MGYIVKLVGVLFLAATVAVVFQLSSAWQVQALNVRTEIKADPPGIVKIIEGTGDAPAGIADAEDDSPTTPTGATGTYLTATYIDETEQGEPTSDNDDESTPSTSPSANKTKKSKPPSKPDAVFGGGGGGATEPKVVNPKSNRPTTLTINTDIEFGNVFPGETPQGEFTVILSNTDPPLTYVEYHITSNVTDAAGDWLDLTPYLTIELDPDEVLAGETDNMTSATLGVSGDVSDHWLVTFYVPNDPTTGDYWSEIIIHVTLPAVKPVPPPTQEP